MGGDYVLGIDCGTSAVKAAVWNPSGEMKGFGRRSLEILNPKPSFYEQDAESWVLGTYGAVRQAIGSAERDHGVPPGSIGALSISHQRESFVPAAQSPIGNALLWMDERAGGSLKELAALIDPERFRAATGKALSANLSYAKLAWLKRNQPELFSSAEIFLDTHAYVMRALTGEAVTGLGSADPTGLFDMKERRWSGEILDSIGLDEGKLPRVAAPGTTAGTLTKDAACACGLPPGIPVAVGLGDGQSAGLGCGIMEPGESYLSLGTSIVSGTFSREYLTGSDFRISFGGVENSYFLETVILGGAFTVDWFLSRFCTEGEEPALRREAAAIGPGAEGLMLVPYWSSAMNPYWDPSARGITVGWTPSHGKSHFYRAILEGLAFEQRLHTDGVEKALSGAGSKPISGYVVTGGGAGNELWLQIIADVTGRTVRKAAVAEAGCLGAGMLAAPSAGLYSDVLSAAAGMSGRDGGETEPDPGSQCVYGELFNTVYSSLYPLLSESMKALNRIQLR